MKNLYVWLAASLMLLVGGYSFAVEQINYAAGSVISDKVTVFNADDEPQSLRDVIAEHGNKVNVVFIFGGGGLGHALTQKTGGLWCPDSFEDMHILRSLKAAYGEDIGIFPIAVPPAHHTAQLGMAQNAFLNQEFESREYQTAVSAFIDSTQAAVASGVIPAPVFYDSQYNLIVSPQDLEQRDIRQAWHGAFRSASEKQTYGVPALWLLDRDGRVLAAPFRGNIYHPHGGDIVINYTLPDVVEAIKHGLK